MGRATRRKGCPRRTCSKCFRKTFKRHSKALFKVFKPLSKANSLRSQPLIINSVWRHLHNVKAKRPKGPRQLRSMESNRDASTAQPLAFWLRPPLLEGILTANRVAKSCLSLPYVGCGAGKSSLSMNADLGFMRGGYGYDHGGLHNLHSRF